MHRRANFSTTFFVKFKVPEEVETNWISKYISLGVLKKIWLRAVAGDMLVPLLTFLLYGQGQNFKELPVNSGIDWHHLAHLEQVDNQRNNMGDLNKSAKKNFKHCH